MVTSILQHEASSRVAKQSSRARCEAGPTGLTRSALPAGGQRHPLVSTACCSTHSIVAGRWQRRRSSAQHVHVAASTSTAAPESSSASFVHGWSTANLAGDLFGGLTAAVVALPLALAFGVAAGLLWY